jgi:hypothetical protein
LQLGGDAPAARTISNANRDHFLAAYRSVRLLAASGGAGGVSQDAIDLAKAHDAAGSNVTALAYLQRMLQVESTELIGATTAVLAPADGSNGSPTQGALPLMRTS